MYGKYSCLHGMRDDLPGYSLFTGDDDWGLYGGGGGDAPRDQIDEMRSSSRQMVIKLKNSSVRSSKQSSNLPTCFVSNSMPARLVQIPPNWTNFGEGIRIPLYSTDPHKIAVGRGWTTVWLAGCVRKPVAVEEVIKKESRLLWGLNLSDESLPQQSTHVRR